MIEFLQSLFTGNMLSSYWKSRLNYGREDCSFFKVYGMPFPYFLEISSSVV